MPEFFPAFRPERNKKPILFKGARVYEGAEKLSVPKDVLVVGNLIHEIGQDISPENWGAVTVDCSGYTLMPGLIDMHSHLCIQEGMLEGRDSYDQMAMGAMCGQDCIDYLLQGFTTCRDAGGNVLGMAKAIDNGRISGPRIFASGAFLSQTGGHGDTGCGFDQPGDQDTLERCGFSHIVDGRPEMLRAARNNLRNGATQLKIMAGSGCASAFDPIHMTQFTEDEMRAAVEVAKDYGTYVLCHAYHDDSINRCLDAGVRCIEHGFLMGKETMKRIKELGAAISLQCVMSLEAFAEPEKLTFFTKDQRKKAAMVSSGAKEMMRLVRKYKPLAVAGGVLRAVFHTFASCLVPTVSLGAPFPASKTSAWPFRVSG